MNYIVSKVNSQEFDLPIIKKSLVENVNRRIQKLIYLYIYDKAIFLWKHLEVYRAIFVCSFKENLVENSGSIMQSFGVYKERLFSNLELIRAKLIVNISYERTIVKKEEFKVKKISAQHQTSTPTSNKLKGNNALGYSTSDKLIIFYMFLKVLLILLNMYQIFNHLRVGIYL